MSANVRMIVSRSIPKVGATSIPILPGGIDIALMTLARVFPLPIPPTNALLRVVLLMKARCGLVGANLTSAIIFIADKVNDELAVRYVRFDLLSFTPAHLGFGVENHGGEIAVAGLLEE